MTEWLETDGLGGYAMGTSDLVRTRRYHGLLIAATQPPGGRMLLVAGLEVYAGDEALSAHRYAGDVVHPDGATRIAAFSDEAWPRWELVLADGARIVHELVMVRGGVVLRWTQVGGAPRRLRVRPLLAGRDHHATHHENGAFAFAPEGAGEVLTWRPYAGVPAIVAQAPGATYRHAPDWYRRFRYAEEIARGFDGEEDLASPGEWTWDLGAGPAVLAFGTAPFAIDGAFAARGGARDRAIDAYLVARGAGRTVIAGYPWFTDWGRDTFIALRGLRAAGRVDDARRIVEAWSRTISAGMVPNRFLEAPSTSLRAHGLGWEYNSVDASLWFVIAAAEVGGFDGAIAAIVDGYTAGTRHGIHADADGLLACGEPGVQLTWMDAKVDGRVITPRIGKPVEVQALWANALAIAGRAELLARVRASFAARFWNPARGCLLDVVDPDDPAVRPNQLFAVGGLPLALLEGARARAVVDVCERLLWTVAGPRSLAPDEPAYVPWYGGSPAARDGAYHQGPVWPWLTGAFVSAWVRVRGDTAEARRAARARFVEPLRAHFGGVHLPELAQPEPPHAPAGCPFQAWSLAELLRLELAVLR